MNVVMMRVVTRNVTMVFIFWQTTVLSNADPMLMKSIQDELTPESEDQKIESCRMVSTR
jgi:hypothetical protein